MVTPALTDITGFDSTHADPLDGRTAPRPFEESTTFLFLLLCRSGHTQTREMPLTNLTAGQPPVVDYHI